MKIQKPMTVTAAMLTSNIPELDPAVDPAAWNAATNYATGALVGRTTTHMVYKRLSPGGVDAALPESDATKWKPVYPTNRWGCFDTSVGTKTVKTGAGDQTITMVIVPGVVTNSAHFFELNARTVRVRVKDAPGGTLVYDKTITLDETELLDWYAYFFEPFTLRTVAVFDDLPPYLGCEITIDITGNGTVAVGNVALGNTYLIGSVGYGATAGVRSYSKKTEDPDTGVVTVETRKFAKIMRVRFKLTEAQVNYVHGLLSDLLDVPCTYIADNGAGLEPFIIYGFYKDFSLELPGPVHSYYSLEVEGMV